MLDIFWRQLQLMDLNNDYLGGPCKFFDIAIVRINRRYALNLSYGYNLPVKFYLSPSAVRTTPLVTNFQGIARHFSDFNCSPLVEIDNFEGRAAVQDCQIFRPSRSRSNK